MARIEDLLTKVDDPVLRADLEREVAVLKEHVDFGLVFERHIPETVDLLYVAPSVGDLVRNRREGGDALYRVFELERDTATLTPLDSGANVTASVDDLLVVKPFGEPVYPTLTPLGSITRSEGRPFHAVVNGENLHVVQLLFYLYEGQVDCLYLDPPYNSGAADWKYNNRYVDATDRYRHSKWLSMMERRLRLAKRLLKPDGVLIVTIDENEVYHLGVLLEDLFREYVRHQVTIVINPKGTAKVNFSRVDEYALFLVPDTGTDVIAQLPPPEDEAPETEWEPEDDEDEDEDEAEELDEEVGAVDVEVETVDDGGETDHEPTYNVLYLRRRGVESSARSDRWRQFYAIYVDEEHKQVVGIGPPLAIDEPFEVTRENGVLSVYPIDAEGNHRVWRYGRDTMQRLIDAGEIRVGMYNARLDTYTLNHWKPVPPERAGIRRIRTVWWRTSHDAGTHGSTLLTRLLGKRGVFSFPKSVYATRDCLEAVVKHRPDALIVDFFAGSGTTLHSTLLLNQADGGRRRCVRSSFDPPAVADVIPPARLPKPPLWRLSLRLGTTLG
jgi:adenine-specific DNA-methyltransferase